MTTPTHTFASLGLSELTLGALKAARYTTPTPIQVQAIPPALAGRDVIGSAATGTGKTAAFALPMIERLAGKVGTRALVLAPTRELVLQIAEHVEMFGAPRKVRAVTIIGGVGMGPQVQGLRDKREIIIATPGRLIDHLEQHTAKLDGIEILVLDEADRMLDMGFKPQLEKILAKLPKQRQSLLFSATMAGEVAEFARKYLKDPAKVEVARSGTTAARADQKVFLLQQEEKTALLLALLSEDDLSTLVFTRTKRRADRVARQVERGGHKVSRIHADRSQGQRKAALDGFKSGEYRVLIATDIAARGIDVEEIGHVINYDLPHVPEDYVHRVGRTARAAASGRASSFVSPEEQPLLKDIEKYVRTPIARSIVPRDSPIFREENSRKVDKTRDPGPRQQNHGVTSRAPGQAPGRHARTHRKPQREQGSGGQQEQAARPAATVNHDGTTSRRPGSTSRSFRPRGSGPRR